MIVRRQPRPELRGLAKTLWATAPSEKATVVTGARERGLPTGDMHLAFRLNSPLRLFRNIDDAVGDTIGHAVVGGVRASYCVKDISEPASSVGVQLHAGAAEILFGIPADELAERHTLLDDLWGRSATLILDQLADTRSLEGRLDVLESTLMSRVTSIRRLHPAVAHALTRFTVAGSIHEIVQETGYSHRRFIALFRREVGLPPKAYTRILRFQHAINRVASDPATDWADLALDAGYSDQSHFNREFREFAGVTPEEYPKDFAAFRQPRADTPFNALTAERGFALEISGGHRPPLQLANPTAGALYERVNELPSGHWCKPETRGLKPAATGVTHFAQARSRGL